MYKYAYVYMYFEYKRMCACIYMEIDVLSTVAYEAKKGNPPIIAQKNKHTARDTWMPSLENWGGGLKIFCGMYVHICV